MRIEKPFNELRPIDQAFFLECYSIHLGIKNKSLVETLRRCFMIGNPGCIIDLDQKIMNITPESVITMKIVLRAYLYY